MRFLFKAALMAVAISAISLSATTTLAGDVTTLPGYAAGNVLNVFAKKVANDDSLYDYLRDHSQVSTKVLNSTSLQTRLVSGDLSVEEVADMVSDSPAMSKEYDTGRAARDLAKATDRLDKGSLAPMPGVTKIIQDPAPTPYVPPVGKGDDTKVPVGDPEPPHHQPPQPVDEAFDVNEVVAAGSSLDAKGWPKYLKVPADCPAPTASVKYYYENRFYNYFLHNPNANGFGPVAPSQNGALGWNQIQPYHKVPSWFLIGMTDVEQFAIPFHTANASGYTVELSSETHPVPQTFFQIAYAHCPGDFTNATPAGEETLADMGRMGMTGAGATVLAIVADKNRPYPSNNVTQLRPNKRYFMNIRPIAAINPESEDGCDKHFPNITKRDGRSICWRLLVGRSNSFVGGGDMGFFHSAPYAGPCLTEGPYPENYNSETCGASMVQDCVMAGENATTSGQANEIDFTCYDPSNDKAPQRFVRQCNQGRTMAWTTGYNKPAFSNYVCELTNLGDGSARMDLEVCAAPREGEMRELVCDGQSKYIDQCLFDRGIKRFAWVKLQSNGQVPNVSASGCRLQPYERPLVRETCLANGQEYPVGTVQTIACHVSLDNRTATMLRTCQKMQTGSSAAGTTSVPLFVQTGGEAIPESEIRTTRPYSCSTTFKQPGTK